MNKFEEKLRQNEEKDFSFPEAFEQFFNITYQTHASQIIQQEFLPKISASQPLDIVTKYFIGGESTFFELLEIRKPHIDALNLQEKYQILFDECIATATINPVFAVTSYYEMIRVENYDSALHAFVSLYHMPETYYQVVHAKQGEISTNIDEYEYINPDNISSLDNEEYNKLATGLLSLNYARDSLRLSEKMHVNYWQNHDYQITYGQNFNETSFTRGTYKYFSNMVVGKELF